MFSKELLKKYGSEVAKKLPQRIVQLEAFCNLNDVPITKPFRRHKLEGDKKDYFAINITDKYRLIFRPEDIEEKDLKKIEVIEIVEVSKHYE